MRWFLTAVVFVGLVCTVRSQDEPVPSIRIMARSTVYNVDETKAIFCKGENLVEPIQWYSPSKEIVEERSVKNNRIFVERKNEDNGVLVPLIIHRIKISDSGIWTCKSGNLSEAREFIVGEKVNIVDKNVSLEGEEGKNVRLTCEAKGHPTPVVVWYKENNLIKDDKKYVIKADHSLEIKRLNHADVGLYTCKVRQKALSHYTEKNVQLTVQHKPIFYNNATLQPYLNQKYKTEEIYAILNDTKNVTCSAIANPPPTYRWFRRRENFDDDPITEPDTVITAEDGSSSVLILRVYNSSYFGEYKCTAKNTQGTESIVFHVSAGSKPDPPDFVSFISANTTELTFNVSCSTCIFPEGEDVSPDPKSILGYSFQFVAMQEGYEADWTAAIEREVDVTFNNTLYTVGMLPNNTKFHAQVRTRNAAGYSDWVDIPGAIATTAHAIKIAATALMIFAAIMFTRLY